MKVAIYARVSTAGQEHEKTVQSQLTELRAKVREDGLGPAEEFVDEGYSRIDLDRPELRRLQRFAEQGLVDRVYVLSPDRLAGGHYLKVLLIDHFGDLPMHFKFLQGDADDTAEGSLMLGFLGEIAGYERAKIAERTQRGKKF